MTDQLALFAPGFNGGDVPSIDERRRAATGADQAMLTARFDLWWKHWPPGRSRGDRQTALRAWRKAVKAGVPITELDRQQEHYLAARRLYRSLHSAEAPLMHGSTFLNSKRVQWDEPWSEQDVRAYWPPPRGWDAKETGAERMRRVMAQMGGGHG